MIDAGDAGIEELDIGVSTYHALRRVGVRTIADLTRLSRMDLLAVRGIGPCRAHEVVASLVGLSLSMADDGPER